MRAYFFTHYMMSPIQQGIQALHCCAEMFVHVKEKARRRKLELWAADHKTVVLLNGGDSISLGELYDELQPLAGALRLPLALFYEDQSLKCALTAVGIIVPPEIYNATDSNPIDWGSKHGMEKTALYVKIKPKELAR